MTQKQARCYARRWCPASAVVGGVGRGLSTCPSAWPEAHQGGFAIKFCPHLMLNVIAAVGLCGGDSILAEQKVVLKGSRVSQMSNCIG